MDRRQFLNQFHNLPAADYDLLTSKLKPRSFKKGESVIVPGQMLRELYFVRSGVQMSYFESENKAHVIVFTYAPNLCTIPDAFSFQVPSRYFLTCLTDSEMDYLTFEELQELFDQSQAIERLFRKLTEAVLAGVINRHVELHSMSIEERFKTFCNRSAHLLHIVPHKHLASYLAIDATNFSKLFNRVKF